MMTFLVIVFMFFLSIIATKQGPAVAALRWELQRKDAFGKLRLCILEVLRACESHYHNITVFHRRLAVVLF